MGSSVPNRFNAAGDDADDAFHVVGVRREGLGELGGFDHAKLVQQAAFDGGPGRLVQQGSLDFDGRRVEQASLVADDTSLIQHLLDGGHVCRFGEGRADPGADIRLVNQVGAAAKVQSQLQSEGARAPALDLGEAGNVDVDFRESQGSDGNREDGQNQNCQPDAAATHELLLVA